jgi:3-oxoacyl-[acyl-carrier-protein] synthase III
MGVRISAMNSVHNRDDSYEGTVMDLAISVLNPLLQRTQHSCDQQLIVATTCPDTLAPTLGQRINQYFNPYFQNCQVFDLVQGCTGGLSALLLASQLTESSGKRSVVVVADAARKALSPDNNARQHFSNGAFACLLEEVSGENRLLHHKVMQFEDLTEVVRIKLGHDARGEIVRNGSLVVEKPVDHLGLTMDPKMALRLIRRAEQFYIEFCEEYPHRADVMVFHQVNPAILNALEAIFRKHTSYFVNMQEQVGNCGAASYAVALSRIESQLPGKKVLLCSFGTGGVICAGLWQF